jgi:hypothetical protein
MRSAHSTLIAFLKISAICAQYCCWNNQRRRYPHNKGLTSLTQHPQPKQPITKVPPRLRSTFDSRLGMLSIKLRSVDNKVAITYLHTT